MSTHPDAPNPRADSPAKPVVLFRQVSSDRFEIDIDARRTTRSFHRDLDRVAREVAQRRPTLRNDAAPDWGQPDAVGDYVDPRTDMRRCAHRITVAAEEMAGIAELLGLLGYVVDLVQPVCDRAVTAHAPALAHDAARAVAAVDPVERCDAPMTARYRQEAGASCGQRAYVVTAYDGGRTLAWCLHHFDAFAERSGAPVVADSRPLLLR